MRPESAGRGLGQRVRGAVFCNRGQGGIHSTSTTTKLHFTFPLPPDTLLQDGFPPPIPFGAVDAKWPT